MGMLCVNSKRESQTKSTRLFGLLMVNDNVFNYKTTLKEGGVRACGIAVLGYFWCGVAVIFISKYGIAVFRVQAVCGKFKFYVAVVGEKIVMSR